MELGTKKNFGQYTKFKYFSSLLESKLRGRVKLSASQSRKLIQNSVKLSKSHFEENQVRCRSFLLWSNFIDVHLLFFSWKRSEKKEERKKVEKKGRKSKNGKETHNKKGFLFKMQSRVSFSFDEKRYFFSKNGIQRKRFTGGTRLERPPRVSVSFSSIFFFNFGVSGVSFRTIRLGAFVSRSSLMCFGNKSYFWFPLSNDLPTDKPVNGYDIKCIQL